MKSAERIAKQAIDKAKKPSGNGKATDAAPSRSTLAPGESPASEGDDRLPAEPQPANGKHQPESEADDLSSDNSLSSQRATPQWPDPPAGEAFHGLPGEIANTIEPHSEADPVAILLQSIVGFGNLIGRTAHFVVEGTPHYLNLFAVLVGITAGGRKGTSLGRVKQVFTPVQENLETERMATGLSSSEGLIHAVRDPVKGREPVREKGKIVGYEEIEVDPGVEDKRLWVVEPEFCNVLKQAERTGNTLSAMLRLAWESGNLRTLTKNSPTRATGAHISLIGHITAEELTRYLSSTEAASGFGNRFLWIAVQRSKFLPEGGGFLDLQPLANKLAEAVAFAKCVEIVERDDAARTLWHEVYEKLSTGKPGLSGALTARAEAQTMRLACIYALMDGSFRVQEQHLRAALALWDYCARSVKFVFGENTGNPLADECLSLLRRCPDGISRTDLHTFLGGHKSAAQLGKALALLLEAGLATVEQIKTAGRPVEKWHAAKKAK